MSRTEKLFGIGDLVESTTPGGFEGIGKVISLDEQSQHAIVAFFESPIRPECRNANVSLADIGDAVIFDEANVYILDQDTRIWRRARYGSQRPDDRHLVLFSRDDTALVSIADIYVLNLCGDRELSPIEFLEARYCDTPLFSEWRIPFVQSYIEQRSACRSISSIISSGVEIEPHQVAVVRRVLVDSVKKYLLADEVGLGKTIEACLVIREHVLQDEEDALVLIAVPQPLIDQWRSELITRFYLGDVLNSRVFICSHDKLSGALQAAKPTMIVIDEAHAVAPWAWSDDSEVRRDFSAIAEGARTASVCLLLSGTPLAGNEKTFLAMLHLLSPESYQLTPKGESIFMKRVAEREKLGGMYQALIPTNDNSSLTDIVEGIAQLFPNDVKLRSLVEAAKPLINWMAPETGEDRRSAVNGLRDFIGENYRLHQRMLRNRREDAAIASLFPGLDGAEIIKWRVDEENLSVDQIIDAYRDEYINNGHDDADITTGNVSEWIEMYLTSPSVARDCAAQLLEHGGTQRAPHNHQFLQEIVRCGGEEQKEKDRTLVNVLSAWLNEHKNGRAIVFCGDPGVADRVCEIVTNDVGVRVERHRPQDPLSFIEDNGIRVLICDRAGEDGLNLHGGEKLLVHYSVPRSFSRIEQRNGRANRYSAAIHAKPIRSIVLAPGRKGLFSDWVEILDKVVRIFNRSVASLQYVLQEEGDSAWERVPVEGRAALIDLAERLRGSDGLLERERTRVRAQEELNSMNKEVADAMRFAQDLEEADEVAERQSGSMFGWICDALLFTKVPGEQVGTFRFKFNGGRERGHRTLVDVASFVASCLTGLDRDASDWSAPVTALMSADRGLVSLGRQVYPMRFGQPFLDTVFSLSRQDSRGICCSLLRALSGFRSDEPQLYFRAEWLVSACPAGSSRTEQRQADETFRPRLVGHWLDRAGELVTSSDLLDTLYAPYKKKPTRIPCGVTYQDVRIRHDMWLQLEEYFPKAEWPAMIRALGQKSSSQIRRQLNAASSAMPATLHYSLETVCIVIAIGSPA